MRQRTEQLTETNEKLEQELNERLRAENALTESEYRYRTIFETTGNATMIAEADNTISMINTAFETLSGYAKAEIEGEKSWEEFFAPEVLDRLKEYFAPQRDHAGASPLRAGVYSGYQPCEWFIICMI